MGFLLGRKPVAQELPDKVKEDLIAKFALEPGTVDKMRFSGKKGRYSNRPVQYFRIYDPDLISHGAPAKVKYEDFQLDMAGDRKALLFDGHIEKDGHVLLTDRRAPTPASPKPGVPGQ